MTDLRTAAQQALEALERYQRMMMAEAGCQSKEGEAAIDNLRAALAEPVQEPVQEHLLQQALEALLMMRDRYGEYACPACDHADAAIKLLRSKQ